MFETLKLDHSKPDLYLALGCSKKEKVFVQCAIFFETITCHLSVTTLYDEPEESPIELRSVTGVLERSLKRLRSDEQRFACLLTFKEIYLKLENVLLMIDEYKIQKKAGTINLGEYLSRSTMLIPYMKMIKTIKKGTDFENFVEEYASGFIKKNDFDVDELLRNVLRRKDDEN